MGNIATRQLVFLRAPMRFPATPPIDQSGHENDLHDGELRAPHELQSTGAFGGGLGKVGEGF